MIIAIDNSNIINICYSVMVTKKLKENGDDYLIKEDDIGFFWHLYLRKIMPYLTTYKKVIFCEEGKGSTNWRKSIWPPYKENRADRKDNPNYSFINQCYNDVSDFLKLFNCKDLRVDNCEADDCIYQICKQYNEEGVRIVSTDKDLTQNINFFDNITQFSPKTEKLLEAKEDIILEKALVGDASDNIKAFRGIGPKTYEKMKEDQDLWNKKMTQENLEILEQVTKIIDLRKYPQEYQDSIVEELNKPWNTFNKQGVENFILTHNLKQCYHDWSNNWCPSIEVLLSDAFKKDGIEEIMDIINS